MGDLSIVAKMKDRLTKWHAAYIQNAYRELERGTTRQQLDALDIDATGKRVLDVGCGPGNLLMSHSLLMPRNFLWVLMLTCVSWCWDALK